MKKDVLQFGRICKIFNTEQIGRMFFSHLSQPQKQASEYLKGMLDEKLLDVKPCRAMNEPNTYRLSKKGRLASGEDFHPIPFSTNKVGHWLGLTDVYIDMCEIEPPQLFITELRDEYHYHGSNYTFSPDIFAVWLKKIMFIEWQRSPISSKRWAKKWEVYQTYYDSGTWQSAPWQSYFTATKKPRIVCVSTQMPDTILPSFEVDLVHHIKEFKDIIEKTPV
jgi:hypothetical protein